MANATVEKANLVAEKAMKSIDKAVDSMDIKVVKAEKRIENEVPPLVRSMLLANYSKSGIKSRSGKLRTALANAKVFIDLKKSKPKITIAMPPGMGKYKDGSDFYEVAASLNYGAIHKSGESSSKRRRQLKKKAQRDSNKKNPSGAIVSAGHVLTGGSKTKAGSTKYSGGTYVTKAHHYWELSSSQQGKVIELVTNIFNEEVFGKE